MNNKSKKIKRVKIIGIVLASISIVMGVLELIRFCSSLESETSYLFYDTDNIVEIFNTSFDIIILLSVLAAAICLLIFFVGKFAKQPSSLHITAAGFFCINSLAVILRVIYPYAVGGFLYFNYRLESITSIIQNIFIVGWYFVIKKSSSRKAKEISSIIAVIIAIVSEIISMVIEIVDRGFYFPHTINYIWNICSVIPFVLYIIIYSSGVSQYEPDNIAAVCSNCGEYSAEGKFCPRCGEKKEYSMEGHFPKKNKYILFGTAGVVTIFVAVSIGMVVYWHSRLPIDYTDDFDQYMETNATKGYQKYMNRWDIDGVSSVLVENAKKKPVVIVSYWIYSDGAENFADDIVNEVINEKGDIYYITSNIGCFLSEMGIKKYQLYIKFNNNKLEMLCNVEDSIVYSASDKMFYGNVIDLMTYSIFDTLDEEEIMSSYTGEQWLIDQYGYVRSSTGKMHGTMYHKSENNTVYFDKGKPIVDLNLITEATQ